MHAVALRFELHVPGSRSLKAKRAAIRPVVEGLRHRLRCSVAETAYQDQWQRAEVAVALVASTDGHLRAQIERVERFVRAAPAVDVLAVEVLHLDPEAAVGW